MVATDRTLRIASRGSALALWQAEHVRDVVRRLDPSVDVEIRIVHTRGDRITDVPLAAIGGRGLFTKEVDRTLLSGEADLAVHSLKDLPTEMEPGLRIGAVLPREDPRDAMVVAPGRPRTLDTLPPGARVGTSSLRRRAQLLARRPDLKVLDLRGNLDTRLRRAAEGHFDAVLLALAGIRRLEREDAVAEVLAAPAWLPAAGQGALALAIRDDDEAAGALLAQIDDAATRAATTAERALLHGLEGGCQVPIGALALAAPEGQLELHAFVADLGGSPMLRGARSGPAEEAERLGSELARELRAEGADTILEAVRARAGTPPAGAP